MSFILNEEFLAKNKFELQQKWPLLTDEDLIEVAGKREVLAGKIKIKYAVSEQESEDLLDDWLADQAEVNDALNQSEETAETMTDDKKYNVDYSGADAGEAVDKNGQVINESFGNSNESTTPPGSSVKQPIKTNPLRSGHASTEHKEKSVDQT